MITRYGCCPTCKGKMHVMSVTAHPIYDNRTGLELLCCNNRASVLVAIPFKEFLDDSTIMVKDDKFKVDPEKFRTHFKRPEFKRPILEVIKNGIKYTRSTGPR